MSTDQNHSFPGTPYKIRGETRSAELDGVRGIAILMVFMAHFFMLEPQSWFSTAAGRLFGSMWLGVDLFFVLSGYLITGILLRSRGTENYFRGFYARRALRIFPAYYVFLVIVFWLLPALSSRIAAAQESGYGWYFIFYVQNWWMAAEGQRIPVWGVNHLWSLAIEEQFYLVWPVLVMLCREGSSLRRLCLVLIAVSIGAKVALIFSGTGWMTVYTATVAHMEGLAAGAWVATLGKAEIQRRNRLLSVIGGISGMALAALVLWGVDTETSPARTAMAISCASGFSGWILYLIHVDKLPSKLRAALGSPVLTWFGRYSYGLYLMHYVMVLSPNSRLLTSLYPDIIHADPNIQCVVRGLLSVLLSVVAALLLFHGIEKRMLALRPYFHPVSRPSTAAAQ